MFSKAAPAVDNKQRREEPKVTGRPGDERRVAAWIGPSIVINGNVTSSENMTVAGQVEGDITVREHALTVAAGGVVRGNIMARAVVPIFSASCGRTRMTAGAVGLSLMEDQPSARSTGLRCADFTPSRKSL